MTITEIVEKLDREGKDTVEIKTMMTAYREAEGIANLEYYQNQIYGFICGLAALRYISPSEINEVMNDMEQEGQSWKRFEKELEKEVKRIVEN
ncbi:MAG: hypothetical protein LUC99_08025 [Clostridiales bacterium]|nr:hypothetical protein [Clostridiales bacterium]